MFEPDIPGFKFKAAHTEHALKIIKRIFRMRLKVPKCEIYHLFDLNDFYVIKSL